MSSSNASGSTTPRSRSRSKRSTTNLSNLRLAPLSTKYTTSDEPSAGGDDYAARPKTPSDEAYARQHSSYLQGKSAPTTPGILSRSSSRRSFSGGLSRRDDPTYDEAEDEGGFAYTKSSAATRSGARADGDISKSQSEAAIIPGTPGGRRAQSSHRRHLSGQGLPLSKRHQGQARSRTGTSTPRALDQDDSWLSRTGSRTSALLHEGKNQSWLISHEQPAVSSDTDDHEDDNYEEMAALSASTAKLERFASRGSAGDEPKSPRVSRWGSRYGSRNASGRTSRYASPVGTRTPRARDMSGYFDDIHHTSYSNTMGEMQERAFVEHAHSNHPFSEDQAEVDRLSTSNSFGLGPVIDKIMNMKIFGSNGMDGGDTTDDEVGKAYDTETEGEARERMARENRRRRDEKEKLVALPPAPADGGQNGEGQVGGWQDAAWLLSVATKAMF